MPACKLPGPLQRPSLRRGPSQDRLTGAALRAAALLALAGCGGGGSGAAPSAAAVGGATAASSPSRTIVLLPEASEAAASVPAGPVTATDSRLPASSHAEGSPARAAFDLLNGERLRCGFGPLQQNAALDAASRDASNYFALRAAEGYVSASTYFHVQDPAKSGFTGAQPRDRAQFRGYSGAFAADFAQDAIRASKPADVRTDAQLSAAQLSDLLSTVYHLAGLMAPITEVGLDFRRVVSSDGWDMTRLTITGGNIPGLAAVRSTAVRSYPCEGVTRVNASFRPSRESPNPAPDLNDRAVGTPIYLVAPEGQRLRLAGATLHAADQATPIALRTIDADSDVFARDAVPRVAVNEAFLLPLAPLRRGVRHQVRATGTAAGAAFSLEFGFTPALE